MFVATYYELLLSLIILYTANQLVTTCIPYSGKNWQSLNLAVYLQNAYH